MIRNNTSSITLLTALLLGWLWDLFFYDKPLGLSFPIYILFLLSALFLRGWHDRLRPSWHNLWLLLPLLFLAAMVCVRANSLVTALNVAASLLLLALVIHFFTSGRLERLPLVGYPVVLAETGLQALARPAPLLTDSVNVTAIRRRGTPNLLPVARGCLLALPVLALFSCLLASADLVFARYIRDVASLDYFPELSEWLSRAITVLAVAWIVAGGLAYATRRRASGDGPELEEIPLRLGALPRLGSTETSIVLTSVNLLFLAFVWIQFTYLFGGEANITAQGYTYAEYARRGFFELLAVAILALCLILALQGLARLETERHHDIFAALGSLTILCVLVMLASAFQRLLLYEDAFGYTQLRIYSHLFMIWLGCALLWLLAVLWLRNHAFAIGALVAILGFMVTLNLINPDALIARQNLARYRATGNLDLDYLITLSDDALPVLIRSQEELPPEERQILRDHFHRRLERMSADAGWRSWQAFHLARSRAHELLLATLSP